MTSIKITFCVYKPSNAIEDALMIDFDSQNGPETSPKLLPTRFQKALEGALNNDSVSKLKKEAAESSARALAPLKLKGFRAHRGRETGRGQTVVLTRRTTLGQAKGSADPRV